VVTIELPALRDRKGDILPLATFFLGRYSTENGKQVDGFSEQARAVLLSYDWPGNVRELENVIERAVVLSDAREIEVRHLPASLVPERERQGVPPIPGSTIAELERYAILKTLEECGGSTSKAAMVLGISTRKIQYKLHEYGEPIPDGGGDRPALEEPESR
jgi:DNA-binding NtrC family response regulator